MASQTKIIDLYNRAVERNHPDPERGIFGRAAMTDFSNEFNRDGKVGIFGLSETKAKSMGWENLESVEESFNAAIELDARSFQKHNDVNRMFMDSAGTSKDSYMRSLDKAYADIKERITFEDGVAVSIDLTKEEVDDPVDKVIKVSADDEDVKDQVKRHVANLGASDRAAQLDGKVDTKAEIDRLTSLLEEYIGTIV